jgi:Flp pilus assembly protein TadD
MCAMLPKAATALALVFAISAPAFAADAPKPQPSPAAKTAAAAPSLKLTPAQRAEADRLEPVARATFWAKVFDADPTDEDAGVRLAVALRNLKRFQEASDVAEQVLVQNPKNYNALLESARAKIGAQQAFFAIAALKTAMTLQPKDWRPVSLLGIAYDETERRDLARETYRQALALSPNNPAVLANLGMSYALAGDAPTAETYLRQAVALAGAGPAERQNLALVLGMQGKLAEAETLIREDLPPKAAAANLAYLKSLASVPK